MSVAALRLGIVGLGSMGAQHAAALLAGRIPRCRLTAVCDRDPARLAAYAGLPAFADAAALAASGTCDAVLVATPHPDHPASGAAVLAAGLHLLMEKPLAVQVADARRLIDAYAQRPRREQVFAAMFNQRTDPHYRALKGMLASGELGPVRRIAWTITDWFRSEAYYAAGGWRGTWRGEGGGVLLNQCPHQLDLWQWLFGMPARVSAVVALGGRHAIEVEDDVTALLEYADGTTGVFATSTGEAPGSNRLEVAADRGRVVIEGDCLRIIRNAIPASEFSRTTRERFAKPPTTEEAQAFADHGGQHAEVLADFAAACLDGRPPLAPGVEGIRSLELGNAMLLAGLDRAAVDLPLDAERYARRLAGLIAASRR